MTYGNVFHPPRRGDRADSHGRNILQPVTVLPERGGDRRDTEPFFPEPVPRDLLAIAVNALEVRRVDVPELRCVLGVAAAARMVKCGDDLSVVRDHHTRRLPHGPHRAVALPASSAVDLAVYGGADMVGPAPRPLFLIERVGPRSNCLRLERFKLPRRRDLLRDHAHEIFFYIELIYKEESAVLFLSNLYPSSIALAVHSNEFLLRSDADRSGAHRGRADGHLLFNTAGPVPFHDQPGRGCKRYPLLIVGDSNTNGFRTMRG